MAKREAEPSAKTLPARRPLVFFHAIAVPDVTSFEGASCGAVMKGYTRGQERFLRAGENSALVAREGG